MREGREVRTTKGEEGRREKGREKVKDIEEKEEER